VFSQLYLAAERVLVVPELAVKNKLEQRGFGFIVAPRVECVAQTVEREHRLAGVVECVVDAQDGDEDLHEVAALGQLRKRVGQPVVVVGHIAHLLVLLREEFNDAQSNFHVLDVNQIVDEHFRIESALLQTLLLHRLLNLQVVEGLERLLTLLVSIFRVFKITKINVSIFGLIIFVFVFIGREVCGED